MKFSKFKFFMMVSVLVITAGGGGLRFCGREE
jgi:hypothetical protein